MTRGLTAPDRARHTALGIDDELLGRAGVCRVTDEDARALLTVNGKSGNFSGIVYPYLHPTSGRRHTLRIRLDVPDANGGKYRSPYGDRRHLYFPPGAAELLSDLTTPVVLVEAEKSALALTAAATRASRPLLVIALGGCWNWRGRIGKTISASGATVDERGPLADFHFVAWERRDVIILFDARPNDSVRTARQQLARVLRTWGAVVKQAHLPDDDLRVNGPDDFVGFQGDYALWHVIDHALPEDFARDHKRGIIANNLDNIRIALSRLCGSVSYNAFRREVWIGGAPLSDVVRDQLWLAIDDNFKFRPAKEVLDTVIIGEAHNRVFHPVRSYLNALTWDGTPRIATWLSAYGDADDSEYVRAVGALVLIAAVRRVRQPGCKFDELLILESPQGTLKSSAIRALCPDDTWFSDDLPLGVDSKQVIERTVGKWIIEAPELHGNRGREAEQLKAFLSRQADGPVRLAYRRLSDTVERQFIIIGTTNATSHYLKDWTGARRFWPVKVAQFDVDALVRDRDQLWAEAAASEAASASIRLPPELWTNAAVEQEGRRAVDPWEDLLEPLLEGDGMTRPTMIPVEQIWKMLGVEANQLDNRHADRVAAIMQRHGFTKGRPRLHGEQTRAWVREEEDPA